MARLRMTTTNRSTGKIRVSSVLVDPSAGSWVCIIQDTAGNTVFSAKGAAADAVSFDVPDVWEGCNITTATNLTAVYIYTT